MITPAAADDPRIGEAIASYLQAREGVTPLDPDDWVFSHPPELRPHLRGFLRGLNLLTPPTVADRPPRTLPRFDRYSGLVILGAGGMGAVYRADDAVLGREVALKVQHARLAADPAQADRFLAEAQTASRLQHPNVAPVYDYGVMPGNPPRPFFSMKRVAGQTLADRIAAFHAAPTDAARDELYRQFIAACDAVAFAHTLGVLHRDLKPANVMVGAFGEVLVMDWGLAKRLDGGVVGLDPAGGAHQTDAVRGTLAYMAPEQATPGAAAGRAADVFGLGAVLCHLLTNRPVYVGAKANEVWAAARACATGPALDRLTAAGAPLELAAVVRRCLDPNPAARPTSTEVGSAVAEFRASAERRAREAQLAKARAEEKAAGERKRRWWQLATATGLVIAAAGVAVFGVWYAFDREDRRRRDEEAIREADRQEREIKYQKEGREGAEAGRAEAEVARKGEATQRAAAEDTAAKLRVAREELARREYGATVQVALQAVQSGNPGAARLMLDRTRPDLRGWEWHYVHRLCHLDLVTLVGHEGAVLAAGFSPDGSRVATAGADGTVRVWDAATAAVRLDLRRAHRGVVRAAAFSPDGARLLTAGDDGFARVWDAATGAKVLDLAHDSGVSAAAFGPDGRRLVTGGEDRYARVWDAATGAEEQRMRHGARVAAVGFDPAGVRVVSAGTDGAVRVWDAATGAAGVVVRGHGGDATAAAFSPDGARLLTAGADGVARVWDAATGAKELELRGHADRLTTAAFDPAGGRAVTASADGTARVWDARTGTELFALRPGGGNHFKTALGGVTAAAFSPDGARLVTGSGDFTAAVWDATSQHDLAVLGGVRRQLMNTGGRVSFSADGGRVAVSELLGAVRVVNAATGCDVRVIDSVLMPVAAFGRDADEVVIGGGDRHLRVWSAGRETARRETFSSIRDLATSPHTGRVATVHEDGTLRIWDILTLNETIIPARHRFQAWAVAFHPDGATVATGCDDGVVRLWDAATGHLVREYHGHPREVRAVAFNLDGTQLATGCHDGTVRVWDTATGARRFTLVGHTAMVEAVAFSPDGARLVTGGNDGTARVWDTVAGAPVLALPAHSHLVRGVAFSPDGARLLTVGGTVRVWDSTPVNYAFRPDHLAPPPRPVWRPRR